MSSATTALNSRWRKNHRLAATLSAQPMTVAVDARDARRGVFHSAVTMPAAPGPMRFVYPKWIPGEHSPSGPIAQVMGMRVTSHGEQLTTDH